MARVEISGIAKSYTKNAPVLKRIDLEIAQGEIFFLLGSSGCGKSTLLRILAGLVEPDSGVIRFDGVEINGLPPEKRRAAMVFQNYALWPHLSVFENVAFGLRTAGVRGAALKQAVLEALELVRLADCADRRVPSLSGGQQQRVALARALAVDPAILLLDEPLSNLDARLRDTMRGEIHRICRARKLTALYVTHDRREALSMADRIAVMHRGEILQIGTPEEIYEHPADRFTAEFLGDVNLLPGKAQNGVFHCDAGDLPVSANFEGEFTAALRPERIRILPPGAPSSVAAEIIERTYLGECCEWRCRAGDQVLLIRESAPPPRRVGDKIALSFDCAALNLLPGRE